MPRSAANTRGRGGKAASSRNKLQRPKKTESKAKASSKTPVPSLTPAGSPYPSGDDVRPRPAGTLTRAERDAADRTTLAATVTGQRHDDETAGLTGHPGRLYAPHACYVCKRKYAAVHHFYHNLCPPCAALNWDKRGAGTDMSGRVALVTGGRAKIGMYVALRLLRDGADVIITTRFPRDAARRFLALARADYESHDDSQDSQDSQGTAAWLARLTIVGIDLRDPRQVLALAGMFSTLDVLVNNAAQTIRRSAHAYAPLVAGELLALPAQAPRITVVGGYVPSLLPALEGGLALPSPPTAIETASELGTGAGDALDLHALLAAQPGPPCLDRLDAAGMRPDRASQNTWSAAIGSIPPAEVLEVQLCNSIAPFMLLNALRPALVAATTSPSPSSPSNSSSLSTSRHSYVVNVSAAEGQFAHHKTPGHAHTNMAKAGLNMLTRTVGDELAGHGVLVTSVDTGWVTDERPWTEKVVEAARGFRCPLDLEDGAARVYDPIVRGEMGEVLAGVLLKDYGVAPW